METMKFGLILTVIPFIVIFQFLTIWWALADMSVKKVRGPKRAVWTLLIILLPPMGSLLYTSLNKQQQVITPHSTAPVKAN